MRPDDAKFLFGFLWPQFQSEQAVTQKILAAVPLGAEGYQPNPASMTAFELARHIAICEFWFLNAILHGQFADVAPPPAAVATCQDVAGWYAENFRRRAPLLEQLPADRLAQPIDYIGLRNDPAVAYLNIAIRHSVHHRGQLSAYLRGMGAKVPAIYVESADEPYADGSDIVPPAF